MLLKGLPVEEDPAAMYALCWHGRWSHKERKITMAMGVFN